MTAIASAIKTIVTASKNLCSCVKVTRARLKDAVKADAAMKKEAARI